MVTRVVVLRLRDGGVAFGGSSYDGTNAFVFSQHGDMDEKLENQIMNN